MMAISSTHANLGTIKRFLRHQEDFYKIINVFRLINDTYYKH